MYIEPFDDEEMTFDNDSGEYYLTEEALNRAGIGLRDEIATNRGINADTIIAMWIKRVCRKIYAYIYEHNTCEQAQRWVIAHDDYARKIIKEAFLAQAYYDRALGDLTLSVKQEERGKTIDDMARSALERTIPCIGHSLTYAGVWRVSCCCGRM